MTTLVEARAAARFAAKFTNEGPLQGSFLLDDLDAHFAALVVEAEPLIAAETQFSVESPAIATVLSRRQWAIANVDSMLELMAPLIEKMDRRMAGNAVSPMARLATGPMLGAQLGTILGFLSQRVLGQYDMLSGHEDQVWFVGPNIVLMEKRFGFVPRDFRLWITLHELTHRFQFQGNPWIQEHFLGLVNALLSGMDIDARGLLGRLVRSPPDNAPIALRLLTPDQRAKFDQLQAFMSVIEGHGNFIMDRIADRMIPSQPRMRETLRGGGTTTGIVGKIISKLLGMELKKAQYVQGQKFFDAIQQAAGSEGVAACFSGATNLPSMKEITDPRLWLDRVASGFPSSNAP